MSLFELLVIFIVAFLVVKPEDLPKIIKKIKEFNRFFTKTKQDIISHFDPDANEHDVVIKDEIDQINFYLEKIASLGSEYEGEYSLEKIRDHHRKLVKKSMKKDLKE
jgi:Sec-independent protein translocase protein TatA